jgi:GntR family transcriptional regulator
LEVRNFRIETKWVLPEKHISQFLEIPEETEVLELDRLRGTMKGPFVMFYSWFHPRVGLTGEEDYTRPLYEIMEKDYSTIAKLSREEVSACAADAFLSRTLEVPEGAPILKRIRMVYDPGRRPVEYNIGYYRGDSFIYKIESER